MRILLGTYVNVADDLVCGNEKVGDNSKLKKQSLKGSLLILLMHIPTRNRRPDDEMVYYIIILPFPYIRHSTVISINTETRPYCPTACIIPSSSCSNFVRLRIEGHPAYKYYLFHCIGFRSFFCFNAKRNH